MGDESVGGVSPREVSGDGYPGKEPPKESISDLNKRIAGVAHSTNDHLEVVIGPDNRNFFVNILRFFGYRTAEDRETYLKDNWNKFREISKKPERTLSEMNFMAEYINAVNSYQRHEKLDLLEKIPELDFEKGVLKNEMEAWNRRIEKRNQDIGKSMFNKEDIELVNTILVTEDFDRLYHEALARDAGAFQKIKTLFTKIFGEPVRYSVSIELIRALKPGKKIQFNDTGEMKVVDCSPFKGNKKHVEPAKKLFEDLKKSDLTPQQKAEAAALLDVNEWFNERLALDPVFAQSFQKFKAECDGFPEQRQAILIAYAAEKKEGKFQYKIKIVNDNLVVQARNNPNEHVNLSTIENLMGANPQSFSTPLFQLLLEARKVAPDKDKALIEDGIENYLNGLFSDGKIPNVPKEELAAFAELAYNHYLEDPDSSWEIKHLNPIIKNSLEHLRKIEKMETEFNAIVALHNALDKDDYTGQVFLLLSLLEFENEYPDFWETIPEGDKLLDIYRDKCFTPEFDEAYTELMSNQINSLLNTGLPEDELVALELLDLFKRYSKYIDSSFDYSLARLNIENPSQKFDLVTGKAPPESLTDYKKQKEEARAKELKDLELEAREAHLKKFEDLEPEARQAKLKEFEDLESGARKARLKEIETKDCCRRSLMRMFINPPSSHIYDRETGILTNAGVVDPEEFLYSYRVLSNIKLPSELVFKTMEEIFLSLPDHAKIRMAKFCCDWLESGLYAADYQNEKIMNNLSSIAGRLPPSPIKDRLSQRIKEAQQPIPTQVKEGEVHSFTEMFSRIAQKGAKGENYQKDVENFSCYLSSVVGSSMLELDLSEKPLKGLPQQIEAITNALVAELLKLETQEEINNFFGFLTDVGVDAYDNNDFSNAAYVRSMCYKGFIYEKYASLSPSQQQKREAYFESERKIQLEGKPSSDRRRAIAHFKKEIVIPDLGLFNIFVAHANEREHSPDQFGDSYLNPAAFEHCGKVTKMLSDLRPHLRNERLRSAPQFDIPQVQMDENERETRIKKGPLRIMKGLPPAQ